MTEEQVKKAILKWLTDNAWEILDYDFPGGGSGRKFHVESGESDKTKGIVIPDIVAIKGGVVLICENKSVDTLSDYTKIKHLVHSNDFRAQLSLAYPDVVIEKVVWGIGYGGLPKHLAKASSSRVDVIISVVGGENSSVLCNLVYGEL